MAIVRNFNVISSSDIAPNQRLDLEGIDVTDASASTNSVTITPTATKGTSTSTGGALNVTMTGAIGAGVVVYSNRGNDAGGRLMVVRSTNAAFNQQGFYVDYIGVNHAVVINHQGTGTSSLGLSVTSTNTSDTTIGATGSQTGRAVLKATHTKPAGAVGNDANAAGLTISIEGVDTAAQGIFVDAPDGTTGKLLNIRNVGAEKLTLTGDGDLKLNTVSMRSYSIRERTTAATINSATNTAIISDTDYLVGSDLTNTSTTVTTVNNAGVYRITAFGSFTGASGGSRGIRVVLNSTIEVCGQDTSFTSASNPTNLSASRVLNLSSSDTVQLQLFQDSGGAVNTTGVISLAIERIG